MKIPFTVDEFLEVFKLYNQAVYPMQIIAYNSLHTRHHNGCISSAR